MAAVRICGDGEDDITSKGSILLWTTQDLVVYRELGLLQLGEQYVDWVTVQYDENRNCYLLCWGEQSGSSYQALYPLEVMRGQRDDGEGRDARGSCAAVGATHSDIVCKPLLTCIINQGSKKNMLGPLPTRGEDLRRQTGNIQGVVPSCTVEIGEQEARYLRCKLLTPINIGVEMPQEVIVVQEETSDESQRETHLRQQLYKQRAVVRYSDGTFCRKRIEWNLENVSLSQKGSYVIEGKFTDPAFLSRWPITALIPV